MSKPYIYQRAEDLGIPVVDAKTPVYVVVTVGDVVTARKADSKHCAFAQAAMRLPKVNAAYFFRSSAYLEYSDKVVRYELPHSAQKEIVSFDRAQIMAPGAYQLKPTARGRTRADRALYRKQVRTGRRVPVRRLSEVGLADAIRKLVDSEPAVNSKEAIEFERLVGKMDAGKPKNQRTPLRERAVGIVGPSAPHPLMKDGKVFRRAQYVRNLKDPDAK